MHQSHISLYLVSSRNHGRSDRCINTIYIIGSDHAKVTYSNSHNATATTEAMITKNGLVGNGR